MAVKEHVVYIHGVQGEKQGESHKEQYGAMHKGIRKKRPDFPRQYAGVEWGWQRPDGTGAADERLFEAQRVLGERGMKAVNDEWDFTLNPARIVINQFRPIVFYNFADMFYYVSADGKETVRRSVAQQIVAALQPTAAQPDAEISLTLLGHSAGSVIAFDLLFYLFKPDSIENHCYLPAAQEPPGLAELRTMAQQGSLRIRRLFTFGSPIMPFAVRSNFVVEHLANGGYLNPAHYGLTIDTMGGMPAGPRWVNLWDRDDPIGWPVEPLMDNSSGAVRDIYSDISDNPTETHDAYWESSVAHKLLADAW